MRERLDRAARPQRRPRPGRRHVSRQLRALAAPRRRAHRPRPTLRHLRRRRPDRPGRSSPARAGDRREAHLAARRCSATISHAKSELIDAGRSTPSARRATGRRPWRASTAATRSCWSSNHALDFDDLLRRDGRAVPRGPRRAGALPGALPLHAGRRVPGHQRRPVRARQTARQEAPQHLRRRRRGSGDLLLAQGRHSQHPATSRATSRSCKVVVLEQNYRSTRRSWRSRSAVISANTQRKEKKLWTENDAGIAGHRPRGVQRAGRGAVRRCARSSGCIAREARRSATSPSLYRTNAQSRAVEDAFVRGRHAVPAGRRHPLLRAPRGQGRAGVPAAGAEPVRRRQPAARHQRAAARHRPEDGPGAESAGRQPGHRAVRGARCASPRCDATSSDDACRQSALRARARASCSARSSTSSSRCERMLRPTNRRWRCSTPCWSGPATPRYLRDGYRGRRGALAERPGAAHQGRRLRRPAGA